MVKEWKHGDHVGDDKMTWVLAPTLLRSPDPFIPDPIQKKKNGLAVQNYSFY